MTFSPFRLLSQSSSYSKLLFCLRCFASKYCHLRSVPIVRSQVGPSYLNNAPLGRLQSEIFALNARNSANDAKLQNTEESPETSAEVVNVTFITHKGEEFPVKGKIGDNLLVLAQEAGIDVDGACCRQLKCTTCHMYLEDDYYDKAEEASEQELDLLDTAKFLKPNSRLTCQIHLTKELEGMRVRLPLGTVNFYVDGHKPSHH